MEELKKAIIDNLYKSNFYDALTNIRKMEIDFPNKEEPLFFYYYLYHLMSWVSHHKKHGSITKIQKDKDKYFKQILQIYNNKSNTYLQLYIFLEENFRTFERYTWFRKYEKSKELLEHSLKENPNNLETQFYILLHEEKTKQCFDFLSINKLDIKIVRKFINNIWFKDEFLDEIQELKKQYNLTSEQNDLYYYIQKKDYKWLYKYFNEDEERKSKTNNISYGEVCFELKKYNKAIKYFEKKDDKNSDDFFILGKCYEKQKGIKNHKEKAIKCYKNFYTNFKSSFWHVGIEKLFKLGAYNEIKDILSNANFLHYDEHKIYFEAKILNLEEKYVDSINKLNGLVEKLHNHHKELKKDIYLLYIINNYKITQNHIKKSSQRVIDEKNFELDNTIGLNYNILSSFQEMQKYIKKLNIDYNNEYIKKTDSFIKKIHNFYIKKIKKLYHKSKKCSFILSENRELYYLSAFEDLKSVNKRICIFKSRIKNEAENPNYYLELGKLHHKKAKLTDKNYKKATQYINKSIELAKKYFVNLDGEPELLLVKIKKSKNQKKALFDKSINDFIFFNSYQKNTRTIFFSQTLYKYQTLSINTLSSLSKNYLYFANPEQLNDPFDVASDSLEKQFKNLKLNKKDFKLCSLSQINDNKLMWSHYTQDHTGICVGYNFLYLPNYVGKDKVKYKNTNLNEKDLFENLIEYWTLKSEDWEYEKEVRLLHYGNKQKIPYTFDINEAIEKNIIALQIESITFGLKFENEDILKPIILEIERKQERKIKLFKAKRTEQKLIIEKVN
jgi:hypothetical protein